MSATMHLVRPGERDARRWSLCGRYVRAVRPGQLARDRLLGTERRPLCTCRACLLECLPGSAGGTAADPDTIDLEIAR